MSLSDYDYDLPEELIALSPAAKRDASRLLHVGPSGLGHHVFADLPGLLRKGDVLVINDTKVFPAALRAIRPARAEGGGGDVEVDINLLSPEEAAPPTQSVWRAFTRPGKRLREGDQLIVSDALIFTVERREGAETVLSTDIPPGTFLEVLDQAGKMPLPPYIARRRAADETDRDRYQTVYAEKTGSIAAPTAGLHFTDEIFAALAEAGISTERVTLHVGAGTFLPVTADNVDDHKMHHEFGEILPEVAARLTDAKTEGRRIVSVGTTSTRVLEAAATGPGVVNAFRGTTDLFIKPGFRFNMVDALITNFHLPKSTLLMLVSAFAGYDRVMAAYREAITERYRFYSYGDACLFERADG